MARDFSPFALDWARALRSVLGPAPDQLDLAMGRGRHVVRAADAGYRVYGVDRDLDRVREARKKAAAEGSPLHAWVADLTTAALPRNRIDLVLCTRYLQRSLWPALQGAVRPGGFVVYETFTVAQRALGSGPRSPDHLLNHGELAEPFGDWSIWFYEEARQPEAVARLIARRPS